MTCAGCGKPLTGRQRRWCGAVCREQGTRIEANAAYAAAKTATPLTCKRCDKPLVGRQRLWCSIACKRDFETEAVLTADVAEHVRQCRTCGLRKPLAKDFYQLPSGTYRRVCRSCIMSTNTDASLKPDAADKRRNAHLLGLYGITTQQYDEILAAQGGVCAVCGRPPIKTRLAVDHDHRTLLVRGLLCSHCNLRVIGKMTNSEILLKASEYLMNPPANKVLGAHSVPHNRPKKKRKRRR